MPRDVGQLIRTRDITRRENVRIKRLQKIVCVNGAARFDAQRFQAIPLEPRGAPRGADQRVEFDVR
jgi:hypothetical protein